MKKLVLAALTLISCHAFAYVASEGDVLRVCSSLSGDADENHCMAQVQGHRFDSGALAVCESLSGNSDTLNCLTIINDFAFDTNALSVCSSESGGPDTLSCLSAVAGKSYNPSEMAFCGRESGDRSTNACIAGLSSKPLTLLPAPVVAPVVPAPKCVDQGAVAVIRAKLLQALKDIDSDHFDQADADIRSALSNL